MRLYDANGDGIVQMSEISDVLSDLVSGLLFLVSDCLDDIVRQYLLRGPLEAAAGIFYDNLVSDTAADPVPVTAIVAACARQTGDPAAAVKSAAAGAEPARAWAEARWEEHAVDVERLLERLSALAQDGPIAEAQCVALAADCLCDIAEDIATPDAIGGALLPRFRALNEALKRSTKGGAEISESLLGDAVLEVLASVLDFLRGGGAGRLVRAFFDLLDVDNDGRISGAELARLRAAAEGAVAVGLGEGLKEQVRDVVAEYLGLMDANGDGLLTRTEVRGPGPPFAAGDVRWGRGA